MSASIRHDNDSHKFYAIVEGKICTLGYTPTPDGKALIYRSAFVPPELRGRHIGEHLVKFALNYAKENHYKVIPSCQFIRRIIERNPEYEAIVRSV